MRFTRPAAAVIVIVGLLGAPLGAQKGKKAADKAKETAFAIPAAPDDQTIVHVLNRIGFGPGPADIERIRKLGLSAYIEQQLNPTRLPDEAMAARLAPFETLTKSTRAIAEEYLIPAQMARREAQQQAQANPQGQAKPQQGQPPDERRRPPEQTQAMQAERQVMMEISQQKLLRAAYSDRQLEEVMVDFWFNHFNVFAGKGQVRTYLNEYERDTIRPHVFGKFRDLLGAVAQSPAMLFYLDNFQSTAAEGAPTDAPMGRPGGRGRGQMGQFGRPGQRPMTIGDVPQGRANQRPRGVNENYARELMELHTLGVDGGYSQKDVQEVARAFTGWTIANPRLGGEFVFDPRLHDSGDKLVLGRAIKGGGKKDGEDVLDILAKHPSTAKFIATKLARRFIADEPPASVVDRAAARFRETDGDIREVVRVIVTSPEFFAPTARRAKVKTPFEFVASAVRAAAVDVQNAMPLVQAMRDLGMPLYMCQPPTGYADRAEAWVNTGALLNRMNFALSMTSGNQRRAYRPTEATNIGDVAAARDTIVDHVLAGQLSDATRTTVAKATQAPQAIALLLGSPEFQRR